MFLCFLILINTFLGLNDSSLIQLSKLVEKKYNAPNKKYVVLIDYSKSINSNRLFLIDMEKSEVILQTKVSHAGRSGVDKPYIFSNEMNSKKTSLGLYLTKKKYYGKFGLSLKLSGLSSTNSNAEKRAIVFHSTKKMKSKWSWGCFATDEISNNKLIRLIQDGCLVYVYN